MSESVRIPQNSLWIASAPGGPPWVRTPIPMRRCSWSQPIAAAATAAATDCGRRNFRDSQTRSVWRSSSDTSRRALPSGIRSNTDCSHSSARTGVEDLWRTMKSSWISSATPLRKRVSRWIAIWIRTNISRASRSTMRNSAASTSF